MKRITLLTEGPWALIGLNVLLIAGIYHSTLTWLIIHDWAREDFSYCYLVPLIILYLIWERRGKLVDLPSVPSWGGLAPLVVGLSLFWLGELGGEYFTLYISLWLVIVGLCWIYLGWQKIKTIAFVLFFALSMFPLPNFLYGKLAVRFKLISSWLGVALIQLWGLPAFREGNIIDLGSIQLQVVDACSGLRYLIPLIMLGFIMAYFYKATFWKRALLVVSTLPLAIVLNGIRIALTGILCQMWDPDIAEGFFHDFSGWFIFMISLGLLLLEIKILNRIKPASAKPPSLESSAVSHPEQQTALAETSASPPPRPHHFALAIFSRPASVISLILLTATLAASQGINFHEKIPPSRPLSHFPLRIGEWTGLPQRMDPEIVDSLDLSDYLIVDYQDRSGANINFYVAYYESQRKGESIHSPETCLPGSGWVFEESKPISLDTPGYYGGKMRVNRSLMHKMGQRQLSYYWFAQRGRVLTNAYQLKFFTFWDALTMHRTDGALIRVITPVYDSEEIGQADARIQRFIQNVLPLLAEYLPGKEINPSRERQPIMSIHQGAL